MSSHSHQVQKIYQRLCRHAQQTAQLDGLQQLLEWDECTKMPPAGGAYRAEQVAQLAGIMHQRETDSQLGEWLEQLVDSELASDPHGEFGTVIRCLHRDYQRRTRLPQALVEEQSRVKVLGQQAWAAARKENDFAAFAPHLEKTYALKRQEAEALGYERTPYDALLAEYEPGETTANVEHVFAKLRDDLVPLVQQILGSDRQPTPALLQQTYAIGEQKTVGRIAAEAFGYDFNAGRIDVTEHPFCCTPGAGDVRITTRYDEANFADSFFSTLHEVGHALYEQGLPREHFGLPTAKAVSLGIHESQSRLWENQVALSREFWMYFLPQMQQYFPQQVEGATAEDFYRAANCVRASLIRVDADEVTYNLHIFIRFELEKALIENQLTVAELPEAWNQKYEQYLGIQPPTDAKGVLQDVHWAAGLVGYFPTYALGNLYAAQFFAKAQKDLGDVSKAFEQGEFVELLAWLRKHIHSQGERYAPGQLVERVTGQALSHRYWIDYVRNKYGELYQL